MWNYTKHYICNVDDHTMQDALFRYLSIKMHPQVFTMEGETIVVRGLYNRNYSIVSQQEKCDKFFNWKRPTAEISNNGKILYINCFPGIDYVHHYAALIKSYFHINKISGKRVFFELPTQKQCINQLLATNITQMPSHDIIVVGKVENLLSLSQGNSWEGDGDFLWISNYIAGKKLHFLDVNFRSGVILRVPWYTFLGARQRMVLFILENLEG